MYGGLLFKWQFNGTKSTLAGYLGDGTNEIQAFHYVYVITIL